MLRFAELFRSAHETVKLSEKDLADTENGVMAAYSEEAVADTEEADTELSATIVHVTGLDFGDSSLSRIASPVDAPPMDICEEALWEELCALDVEELTAVLEDASAVLFSDGTLPKWLHWRRQYHGSDSFWVPDGTHPTDDHDQWRRFNPKP